MLRDNNGRLLPLRKGQDICLVLHEMTPDLQQIQDTGPSREGHSDQWNLLEVLAASEETPGASRQKVKQNSRTKSGDANIDLLIKPI